MCFFLYAFSSSNGFPFSCSTIKCSTRALWFWLLVNRRPAYCWGSLQLNKSAFHQALIPPFCGLRTDLWFPFFQLILVVLAPIFLCSWNSVLEYYGSFDAALSPSLEAVVFPMIMTELLMRFDIFYFFVIFCFRPAQFLSSWQTVSRCCLWVNQQWVSQLSWDPCIVSGIILNLSCR